MMLYAVVEFACSILNDWIIIPAGIILWAVAGVERSRQRSLIERLRWPEGGLQ